MIFHGYVKYPDGTLLIILKKIGFPSWLNSVRSKHFVLDPFWPQKKSVSRAWRCAGFFSCTIRPYHIGFVWKYGTVPLNPLVNDHLQYFHIFSLLNGHLEGISHLQTDPEVFSQWKISNITTYRDLFVLHGLLPWQNARVWAWHSSDWLVVSSWDSFSMEAMETHWVRWCSYVLLLFLLYMFI